MRWYNLTAATTFGLLSLSTISPQQQCLSEKTKIMNQIDHLYVIGDSLSDNGALVGAGTQFFKGNKILPKIQEITMEEPYHNNQFCNGANAVSVVADYFHKPLTPAWRFKKIPVVGKTYEQVGENYAVGAGRLGNSLYPGNFFVNLFSAQAQVHALLAQHKNINNHDWVLFVMGANDLLAVMQETILPFPTWKLYLDSTIFLEKLALITLLHHNVSNIVVTDVTDISETPAYNNDPDLRKTASQAYTYFHSQWKIMIQTLKEDYPQQINDFDLSAVVKETLTELSKTSINIKEGASDINFYESFLSDGKLAPKLHPGVTLDKVNDYFFVDSVHPTEISSKIIGTKLAKFISDKIEQNLKNE